MIGLALAALTLTAGLALAAAGAITDQRNRRRIRRGDR